MTKTMSRSCCFLVFAMLLSAFILALSVQSGVATAKGRQSVGSLAIASESTPDVFTENMIGYLEQGEFQVSQGYPMLYTMNDCYERTYPTLKSCFLGNPAAPYVLTVVNLWPDDYMDPTLVNAFVETDPKYTDKDPEYTVTYRLDPREAIVIYGQMPPPGRYMGLQTWEFSAPGKWKPKDYSEWANTQEILETGISTAMALCNDYLPEIEATIEFVAGNLKYHGIAYEYQGKQDH